MKDNTTTEDLVANASDLLALCGGSMDIEEKGTKPAPWADTANPASRTRHYEVTLRNGSGASYVFDFWCGLLCAEPTEYDVLACLEWSPADTFNDFCDEFGCDTDSRMAYGTWKADCQQAKCLKRISPNAEHQKKLAAIR